MFEQLGLIGCGLMGGSFALALKKAGLVKRVVGYSKSPSTTDRARQLGVIDVEAPSALLAVAGADIVLVAVPVAATEATLKAIKHLVTPQMLIMMWALPRPTWCRLHGVRCVIRWVPSCQHTPSPAAKWQGWNMQTLSCITAVRSF